MSMANINLDSIDRTLCDALQKNGRIHFNELAPMVSLSVPAVSERVRKLEERGVIQGFHAHLNPEAFDLDILAFIFVTVDSSANYKAFLKKCKQHPEILECHATTGDFSHLLKIRTCNTASLEKLLSDVQRWDGVRKTLTNLVLSTHSESLAVPTGAQEPPAVKKTTKPRRRTRTRANADEA
jgi:Lrp/AsnC family leucine-responsive transcriptional regulator